MVKTVFSDNGQCAGYSVTEIYHIPNYELIDDVRDKAAQEIQDHYTRFIGRLLKDPAGESISYELRFISLPVSNQIYAAQVKMYFIVRCMGASQDEVCRKIESVTDSAAAELESLNYGVRILQDDPAYDAFMCDDAAVDRSNMYYIAKNEKALGNVVNQNSAWYFNDVIYPSVNANMARITNVMTTCPNTSVSIQIIPTAFRSEETMYFQQGRTAINYMIGQIRFRQGMQPADPFMQSVASAFDYYCTAATGNVAYCNCIVCDSPGSSALLSNKVTELFENENERTGALTVTPLPQSVFPAQGFSVEPWALSNLLVYQLRDPAYWQQKNSPVFLKRLRSLFTVSELKSVFKLPYDDGTVIGLDIVSHRRNRERLTENIISDDTFKMGIIQSAAYDGNLSETYAGVPINDFTKHALIVGTPGSGKTYFSLGMLVQMWEKFHVPFLVVEPTKNEYRSLIDIIPELQVFTPGKSSVSPFIINPFIPPKNVTMETYSSALMNAFRAAFSMPDPLPEFFQATLNEAYNEYGWRPDSTSDDPYAEPFGMYEFIRVFRRNVQRMEYKGDAKNNIETAGVVRLVSLLERNADIYDTIHTIPMEDLVSKPTVIELNAINDREQKSLIMAFILTSICAYTKNNPHYGGLRNLLMIDEAHVLLDGSGIRTEASDADSVGQTAQTIENMIAEIRACGTSIVIADQSPQKVGKGIVGNTNIKMIFRLVEKDSKDIIKNAINLNDLDYDRLAVMGQGEAILHHGRLKTEPLKIKTFSKFTDKPFRESLPDSELMPLCHYWDDKPELLIPHKECAHCQQCAVQCDRSVKANADFIATRLMHAYYKKVVGVEELKLLLYGCNKLVLEIARERNIQDDPVRLINCTKIKLFRKFLIQKNFDVTKKEYQQILNNRRFLIKEEQQNV